MENEDKEDTNKYDGAIPQSIEASGNFIQRTDKKLIIILAIIFSMTFLGYTLIEKVYDIERCKIPNVKI